MEKFRRDSFQFSLARSVAMLSLASGFRNSAFNSLLRDQLNGIQTMQHILKDIFQFSLARSVVSKVLLLDGKMSTFNSLLRDQLSRLGRWEHG